MRHQTNQPGKVEHEYGRTAQRDSGMDLEENDKIFANLRNETHFKFAVYNNTVFYYSIKNRVSMTSVLIPLLFFELSQLPPS